jgi:hypothetical protein
MVVQRQLSEGQRKGTVGILLLHVLAYAARYLLAERSHGCRTKQVSGWLACYDKDMQFPLRQDICPDGETYSSTCFNC